MIVSVIIATYNAEKNLQRALNSVFLQTSTKVEVIVVDGGSTDLTLDIINKNSSRIAWWVSEKDGGIYSAWNKGLMHAKGDWVIFLGADDQFFNATVIEEFEARAVGLQDEYKILYGKVAHTDQFDEIWLIAGESWLTFSKNFRCKAEMLPHQGVFHNIKIFESGNIFDDSFKVSGDYELLLRVLKFEEPLFLDFFVGKMQIGGVSSEFNNNRLHGEFMRARRLNGYPESVWTILLRGRYLMRNVLIDLIGIEATKKVNGIFRRIQGKPSIPNAE